MKYSLFIFFFLYGDGALAQPKTDSLLMGILSNNTSPLIQKILKEKDSFRLQIIYTQINRDKNNNPSFKNYYFNADTNLYFNPASTIKLPVAILALEKLNILRLKNINKFTPLQIDSGYEKQTRVTRDSTAQNYLPSIAHYIKKAFLVSDNDAYNRLYEFVGQQQINRQLHAKGYQSLRITRRFLGLTPEQNRHTNLFRFINKEGSLIYRQPAAYNTDSFYFGKTVKIGKAYYISRDSLINEPIDFTTANNVPLENLQQILQSVLFPLSVPAKQRFKLTGADYKFIYQYLSQYPSETDYPKYDSVQYYDSYVKFYFRDSTHRMPSYVRVFNKVGWAYGFLTDVSYVVDFKNKVEFMLTTTLYANSDEILNDDKYDYETIGWPFLYQLGQIFYKYELKRERIYQPNLQKLRVNYDQRAANNMRPLIINVDN